MTERDEVDAVQAPFWDGTTPRPRVRTWPPAERPSLYIRVNGRWQRCWVHARHDYADGRTAYQVEVKVPEWYGTVSRLYWWDPRAMRVPKGEE